MLHVPYVIVVGSLMYAMADTQPDVSHAVEVLSRDMLIPRKEHWTLFKRVFKYLHGTMNYVIYYGGVSEDNKEINVHGFVDFDWDVDIGCKQSTNGYVFKLFGGAVSWMSRINMVIALSTLENEYLVATRACKEVVCLCSNVVFGQHVVRLDCDS